MSKVVCIYSQERDGSTDFLRPLYNHICTALHANGVGYDADSEEDSVAEIYSAIEEADSVVFMGHGYSEGLYASTIDNFELFNKSNVSLLANKHLFLLACNSADFIKKYNLNNAIGFGHLPTSTDDVKHWNNRHNISLLEFSDSDIELYNNALVNILSKAISHETIADHSLLYKRIQFQTSIEIVQCLSLQKDTPHNRTIADLLYYMQKDIRLQ